MNESLSQLFGAEGALAQTLDGFAPRRQQQEMAEAVAHTLQSQGRLVVEAGTGTGKTFAYLIPTLLSGEKVIVSTGTKHLQDQLFHRDLPLVRKALKRDVTVALLKGRANYLCQHRMELALAEGQFESRRAVHELQLVREWSATTRSGDIAELSRVPERSSVWSQVTSTTDNCLGGECPQYADCYVVTARREAQEADVVVINHYLLFADMALKEEGFGELLPGAGAFVLDEAHQLPEVATQFFGTRLGSRQLINLARDLVLEHLREAGDMQSIPDAAAALEKASADLRLSLGRANQRLPWAAFRNRKEVASALESVRVQLDALSDWLEVAAPRGRGLENCWRRALGLRETLRALNAEAPEDHIQWAEVFTRGYAINLTPLEVADTLRERMQTFPCAWVFTSATLAVGDSFSHFVARMGLEEPDTLRLDSPFDYARRALLYLPNGLPEPNHPMYTQAVVDTAVKVLHASRGRAFLLFTSHRALQEAAQLLKDRIDYPLLVQGDIPRSELLDRFRSLGNAVLLGTGSFWEGVDVRGEALSCVLIDKLPFASPGEPVLQARIEALRARGGNPFMEYQVPSAVIALKQGIGRLIRDVHDSGVLVLCDPRITGKPYGRVFRASLPPMPGTRELADVQAFYERLDEDEEEQVPCE